MNPLQEHPHLFANGKFKIRVNKPYYTEPDIQSLLGCDYVMANRDGIGLITNVSNWIPVGACTLIARPISDMTDAEVENAPTNGGIYDCDWYKETWEDYSKSLKSMNTADFIYLLSIGVYPFDQSHFEDGTVINSTTL